MGGLMVRTSQTSGISIPFSSNLNNVNLKAFPNQLDIHLIKPWPFYRIKERFILKVNS